jgi:hypothetical protein
MLARHTSVHITKASTMSCFTVPDDACRFGEGSDKREPQAMKDVIMKDVMKLTDLAVVALAVGAAVVGLVMLARWL